MLALPEAALAHPPATTAFDATDINVLEVLLRTILGSNGPQTDAIRALGETLGYIEPERQALIAQLPAILDQGSRFLVPTYRAWSALNEADRVAALEDWRTSPLGFRRQIYNGLRQLLLFHAYTDPTAWPDAGYPGPWLGRVDLPRIALRFGEPS